MNPASWVVAGIAVIGALTDAATHGIPAWVQRRIDATDTKLASALGGHDD